MVSMLVQNKFSVGDYELLRAYVTAQQWLVNVVSFVKIQFFWAVLPEISISEPTKLIINRIYSFLIQADEKKEIQFLLPVSPKQLKGTLSGNKCFWGWRWVCKQDGVGIC